MTIYDLISNGLPVLFDGGMGTQLIEAGIKPGATTNLTSPEMVRQVHRRYVEAGAQVVLTNTFSGNRISMEREGSGDQVGAVNREAVRLAREAADGATLIAGDLSSTGEFLEPLGERKPEELFEVFAEQARLLEGVDLLIVETFIDTNEIEVAIRACKEVSSLPIVATMAFEPGERGMRTVMGKSPADCVRAMISAGADIVGANCGSLSPEEMAEVIAEMRAVTDRPLLAQPNGGKPEFVDGSVMYRLGPPGFAEGMRKVLAAGASLVGGCCGTTPDHLRALKAIL